MGHNLDPAISCLNPQTHTLGLLYLLNARCVTIPPNADFLGYCRQFIENADNQQVRIAPEKYASLCRTFTEAFVSGKRPSLCISTLQAALQQLRITENHLTPIHPLLAKVCILSKMYHEVKPWLEQDVTEVSGTGLVPQDIILYFYYGGIVYIGLKNFVRAHNFFAQCIHTPANNVNAIFVEAYKRYILTGLIAQGEAPPLDSHFLSPFISRPLGIACKPYLDIAQTFGTYDPDHLTALFTAHSQLIQQDHLVGLSKQVLQALYRRIIVRLTHTYLTLSLADIATQAKLPSVKHAEDMLLDMTAKGVINARIDQTNGMVSFSEKEEEFASHQTATRLDTDLRRILGMNVRLTDLDRDISCSQSYIAKTLEGSRARFRDDVPSSHRARHAT